MKSNFFITTKLNWQFYWRHKSFRKGLFVGLFSITIILICFPYFFKYIEQRNGVSINDVILTYFHPRDVSVLIFILIWTSAFFMLIAAIKNPDIFLLFLIAYVQLCLLRIITISLFPLQPPADIIDLIDPLSNHFYGVSFIKKDLFFSGHTSTLFLMYLSQRSKYIKLYLFIACFCVGILVLVQHIHYSIDVLFAFPLAYLCYKSSQYLTSKEA